jgi:hypothetical protein
VWISREIQTIDVQSFAHAHGETFEYAARRALATGCCELVLIVDHDAGAATVAFSGLDDLVRANDARLTVVRRSDMGPRAATRQAFPARRAARAVLRLS